MNCLKPIWHDRFSFWNSVTVATRSRRMKMFQKSAQEIRWLSFGSALFVLLCSVSVEGKIRLPRVFRRSGTRSAGPSLRRRLNINSIITEPGTFESEWSNVYSTSGTFYLPTTLKWTPGTGTGFWGRTELSASFDSVYRSNQTGINPVQFSDHITIASTSVVYGGQRWNLAVAPVATFYWRNERGARLGGVALARFDSGLNTAGLSVNWSGATASSPTNPAGTLDLAGGYGRKLARIGVLSHLTPFGNIVCERSSGGIRGVSIAEGAEYQVSEKVAVEMAAQQLDFSGGSIDHQFILGMTVNFGRPRKWFGSLHRH